MENGGENIQRKRNGNHGPVFQMLTLMSDGHHCLQTVMGLADFSRSTGPMGLTNVPIIRGKDKYIYICS